LVPLLRLKVRFRLTQLDPRGKVGLSIWAYRQKKITFDSGTNCFIHSD